MIKELTKVANHLDKLGLTKEADYLDRIIFKIAASDSAASDLVTREIDKKTVRLDFILDYYITSNTVQDKPQAFKDWLLDPATINEKKTAYLFFKNLPIWKDFGYNYFQGISPNTNNAVFPFYSNLLKSLKANPDGNNDIDIIFYNLNKWAIGSTNAMKSVRSGKGIDDLLRNTPELIPREVGDAAGILNPYNAYENLQNPAVARATEAAFDELINQPMNSPGFVISLFLGAPLVFGRGLTRLAEGDYSGAANDILFAVISTVAGYGIGKLFGGIPANKFSAIKDVIITESIGKLFGVAVSLNIDKVRNLAEESIRKDTSYPDAQKEKLISQLKKIPDNIIAAELDKKLKEEALKKANSA